MSKQALIAAYEAYAKNEWDSENELFRLVRKIAYGVVWGLEIDHDFRDFGSSETADDWTQDISLNVWKALVNNTFQGTAEDFYYFVRTVSKNKKTDAFRKLTEEPMFGVNNRAPLFVQYEDDFDGGSGECLNPAIYDFTDRDERVAIIPEFIEGAYKAVCEHLESGCSFAQIAEKFKTTEAAVREAYLHHRLCKHIMAGFNYEQIAEMMGTTENKIKDELRKLRACVAKEQPEIKSRLARIHALSDGIKAKKKPATGRRKKAAIHGPVKIIMKDFVLIPPAPEIPSAPKWEDWRGGLYPWFMLWIDIGDDKAAA